MRTLHVIAIVVLTLVTVAVLLVPGPWRTRRPPRSEHREQPRDKS
ncbi:MAG TPA: hypothetical protein VFY93_13950 [Planctomycetota bacterium]|nr:hypothetical protein [Planctomycetota bacterium]